ncbi:hypothetical protein [Neolewinella persica]|uniref:hypothetical protein n=1 Tax=Neolewinella persica TaxID=70998 RepID=UPI0003619CA9|nr:hypothetical protein [Neolewinella persica]
MAKKNKSSISLNSLRDYLVQVSLIIISLLIAVGVDRCNQSVKNERTLDAYLEAIHKELVEEEEATNNNLGDCEKDIDGLLGAAQGFSSGGDEQLIRAIGSTAQVFVRGVFRSFSPTSFDVMINSGHGLLMKDLELRQSLSGVMAFRENYIKADLLRHDELTLEAIGDFSEYLDLDCLRRVEPAAFLTCLTDRQLAEQNGARDLAVLLRHSEIRSFHLQAYQRLLKSVIPMVEAAREK